MNKIVFVVDDSITNLTRAAEALRGHYTVMTFSSGAKIAAPLEKIKPDIILLDIEMPDMDGFAVLKFLKNHEKHKTIPVIFLTAHTDAETEAKGLEMGVSDFISKPFNDAVLLNRIRHHIDIKEIIAERTAQVDKTNQGIIFILADLVESRDASTGAHIQQTGRLVELLLKSMDTNKIYYDEISKWDFNVIAESSVLHDVGKAKIPDAILKKPGKLTAEEYQAMQAHAIYGAEIIEQMINRGGENERLRNAKIFAVSHHEKWNGRGYPYGLK